MTRKDVQTQTIEKKKKQERIDKVRKKRWGKLSPQDALLLEAKIILGLV